MGKYPAHFERRRFLNGASRPAHARYSLGRDLDPEKPPPSPRTARFHGNRVLIALKKPLKPTKNTISTVINNYITQQLLYLESFSTPFSHYLPEQVILMLLRHWEAGEEYGSVTYNTTLHPMKIVQSLALVFQEMVWDDSVPGQHY